VVNWYIFPVLVFCAKKYLATLDPTGESGWGRVEGRGDIVSKTGSRTCIGKLSHESNAKKWDNIF
jgi:hypothetical protein